MLIITALLRFNTLGKLCGQSLIPTGWTSIDQERGDHDHTFYTDGLMIRDYFWVHFGCGWIVTCFLSTYVNMREDFDYGNRTSKVKEREELRRKKHEEF